MRRKGLLLLVISALLVAVDIWGPLKVGEVHIELAAAPLFKIGPLTVTNSLMSSWVVMLLLIGFALLVRRNLVDTPKALSLQNIVETGFEMLTNFMEGIVGSKAKAFFPMVCTLFVYILTLNWVGLLPGVGSLGFWQVVEGKRIFTPLLRGATSDLSTTLALAICAVISFQVYGIRFLGVTEYGERFVAVGKFVEFFRARAKGKKSKKGLLLQGVLGLFVGILDVFEEFIKVFSFSFRLFGNVFAGEVLLLVMAFLVPFLAAIPFMALELFVGLIQAFIFAALVTAFLGSATTGETHG